jgi:predicted DNA-binding transcriptional regulator YafY
MHDYDEEYDSSEYYSEDEDADGKKNPRLKKTANMLQLAFNMATRPNGVTLQEIEQEFNVKRRTAERMRDCLIYAFPNQIEELFINDGSNTKHWGFKTTGSMSPALSLTAEDILNLERLERTATSEQIKKGLQGTIGKLKILSKKTIGSVESQIESILRSEGYAVRQSPGFKVDINSLNKIRKAMEDSRPLLAKYHGKERKLIPLGIVYAEKTYLVARDKEKGDGIYYFFLHKLEHLRESLLETYKKEDFDLQAFVNQSFGVYQGEIMNVKLSFSPELADEASVYNFHPTQKGKFENDGSYTVSFKASGEREIMWHVFKWGKGCKILAPKKLKDEYKKYLKECIDNNK